MRIAKFRVGLGTFFTLIIVYFIYKYSAAQGWFLLALLAKIYLIIAGIGLLLLLLLPIIMWLVVWLALTNLSRRKKKKYIEPEYKIK